MDVSYGKEEIKIYAFLTNLFQSGFFQLTQFSKETQLRIFLKKNRLHKVPTFYWTFILDDCKDMPYKAIYGICVTDWCLWLTDRDLLF